MRSVLVVIFSALLSADDRTPFGDFEERVAAYMKLHKAAAEADLGKLSPTSSSKQLEDKSKALHAGILARRADAKAGDVFTPAIAAEFRRLIAADVKHPKKRIRQSIRSGEEVRTVVQVNGSYPTGLPLETMPPSLLATFPKLPGELDYRFIGTTLLLRDVTANLIIDFMTSAIALP